MQSTFRGMRNWKRLRHALAAVLCCFILSSCSGDNPVRYSTSVPAAPVGVVATAGDRTVSLNWSPVTGATAYRVYYGTAPGVTPAGRIAVEVPATSVTVTGLDNDTTYYFVVTSAVANGESAPSTEVFAAPTLPGPYVQQDLEGTWNFNVLVSGDAPGWMRGALTVSSSGAVAYTLYQDSAGKSSAPAGLFPVLFLTPTGEVRDAVGSGPGLRGHIASNRALIVGSGPWTGSSRYLAILQKQLPITFVAADVQGFGGSGGGGRRFAYHQICAGINGEWEWGAGQLGRDQKVQYSALSAPSAPALPAEKATVFNISNTGIVTESLTGATPAPALVMDRLVMSGDKSLIVGTATESRGTGPRYVLRIYQMINITPNDLNRFVAADLSGSYRFHTVMTGGVPLTASGILSIDLLGNAGYTSYTDSVGGASAESFSLGMDSEGVVTAAGDPSLHGKLSYFKDMLVFTGRDSAGRSTLTVGMK
ncbi:fibronectin type III domain-containing protein [Geomonas sp. RF6]|uniref:fibronectin type III domain-containing protein n=1 Tax=Geomonas sp. RF6 TaxID=2897342 RepID=UPI001E63741B|nr:fibronectin type III domain-containing protein [Geomonas sp. RF6]UFS70971.1 fibronectin type III domain-containing protein [Geomonas sp. RF6]